MCPLIVVTMLAGDPWATVPFTVREDGVHLDHTEERKDIEVKMVIKMKNDALKENVKNEIRTAPYHVLRTFVLSSVIVYINPNRPKYNQYYHSNACEHTSYVAACPQHSLHPSTQQHSQELLQHHQPSPRKLS